MQPIIEVRNLTKEFQRGEYVEYGSLRDSISNLFSPKKKSKTNTFKALSNISFDIYPGDAIGIVGKNGAGKSTFLKVLSRITPPTYGHAILRGRVASLLEVGTGFHSELTGRENIFFNGTLMGLEKEQIRKNFDSIIDFSGVGDFVDTPLKRYSSGMYVRLAFAVAAHIDPDILIVDEVLAVGDMEFQKKCIKKMDEVRREGKTVIFVSHQMNTIQKLCSRAILLSKGSVIKDGNTNEVIEAYIDQNEELREVTNFNDIRTPFTELYCKSLTLLDANEKPSQVIKSGGPCKMRVHYHCPQDISAFSYWLYIYDQKQNVVSEIFSGSQKGHEVQVDHEKEYFDINIPVLPLIPGTYTMSMVINYKSTRMDLIEHGVVFDVNYDNYFGTGLLPQHGTLFPYEFKY